MFKKLSFLLGLSFLTTTTVFSQNQQKIDSLIIVVSKLPVDTNLVNTYEQIAKLYLRTQIDSAKVYAHKMIIISEQINYEKGSAMGNQWYGQAFYLQGNYDTALVYFTKTKDLFEKSGKNTLWAHSIAVIANVYSMTDKFDTAMFLYEKAIEIHKANNDVFSESKTMLNLARIYFRTGNYTKAKELFYKVRLNFKILDNARWLATTENSIALLYKKLENFDSAISTYNRVIKYYHLVNNYPRLGGLYTNIGSLYNAMGNYDKALDAFNKSLEYRYMVNDTRGLAITKMNMASLYLTIEQYDSIISYLESSRRIFEESNSNHPLTSNLLITGEYYLKINQLIKAEEMYLTAYKISDKYNLKENQKDAAHSLSKVYEKMQEFENALKYARIYKIQYDSLINTENIKAQTVSEEGYKYKLQLLEMEQEIDKEQLQKGYLIIIGSAVILFLILLIFYWRKLQKTKFLQIEQKNQLNIQNARLQTQKEERKRVANILHDNLAHIILNSQSQIKNLINKTDDPKPKQTLTQIEENLDFMNKLAKVASYELAFSFVLEENLTDQIQKYIQRVQHSHSPKISFHHSNKTEFEMLPDETKINVFSVFQEMLGNAIKYAKAGHIGISLIWDDGKTTLQVDDDGIGFNYDEERHGQGFPNMKERAAKLDGTFTYESEIGFGTKLIFVV